MTHMDAATLTQGKTRAGDMGPRRKNLALDSEDEHTRQFKRVSIP